MKIKYTKELLDTMGIFSAVTGASLKDCFEVDEMIYFVVESGQIGKAVGKGAINVKKLQHKFNKKIKIIEFNPDLLKFMANVIFPFKVDSITEADGVVSLKSQDRQTKALLIGRNAKNLKIMTNVVKRYFTISQIKVE
ncbi:NusA-like transcription termination signal-binding factor [Candidatus Woesearchaeota archaeon]|nr:NusA-like transcription termination signal-binding factor [Candidatus Woesearchaeota archaeon]